MPWVGYIIRSWQRAWQSVTKCKLRLYTAVICPIITSYFLILGSDTYIGYRLYRIGTYVKSPGRPGLFVTIGYTSTLESYNSPVHETSFNASTRLFRQPPSTFPLRLVEFVDTGMLLSRQTTLSPYNKGVVGKPVSTLVKYRNKSLFKKLLRTGIEAATRAQHSRSLNHRVNRVVKKL